MKHNYPYSITPSGGNTTMIKITIYLTGYSCYLTTPRYNHSTYGWGGSVGDLKFDLLRGGGDNVGIACVDLPPNSAIPNHDDIQHLAEQIDSLIKQEAEHLALFAARLHFLTRPSLK